MCVVFVKALILLLVSDSTALSVYKGDYNYSTYYEGNSPIIILSQHGGDIKPNNDTIPDRQAGCWNGTDCLWFHNCQDVTPFSRDSTNCGVKTLQDAYTKDIALCLRENIVFNLSNTPSNPCSNRSNTLLYPHLVINELHRIKLDANREYGEATLNNSIAANTWNEIHSKWMQYAKDNATEQCNFGLVFDIHGQAQNDYNQLGYRISQSQLLYNDNLLNDEIDSTSIRSLAEYNLNNYNISLSSIIRGNYSLGNYLNNTIYGSQLMIPSLLQPNLGDYDENGLWYYQGGFGLQTHGSQYGGNIDAIQIEVNRDNRWESELRDEFCQQFSQSVIQFVYHWYNISNCDFMKDSYYNENSNDCETTETPTTTTDESNESSEPDDDDVAFQNKLGFPIACVAPLVVLVTFLTAFV